MGIKWSRVLAVIIGIAFMVASIFVWIGLITDKNPSRYNDSYITENDWQGWLVLGVGVVCLLLSQIIGSLDRTSEDVEGVCGLLEKISKIMASSDQKAVHSTSVPSNSAPGSNKKIPAWKKVEEAQKAAAASIQTAPAVSTATTPTSSPAVASVEVPVATFVKTPNAFCQRCGHKREADTIFCQFCGNKF